MNVLLPILYFVLFFGFFEAVMFRKGMTYWQRPLVVSIYFLVATALSLAIFSSVPLELLSRSTSFEWISLGVLLSALMLLARKGCFAFPRVLAGALPEAKKESLKYVFSKSTDILFQDVLAVIVVLAMQTLTNNAGLTLVLFALYFLLTHILLVFVLPIRFALLFVVASAVAGLAFGWLILYEQSIIYVFVLHWAFYALAYPVIRRLLLRYLSKGQ